MVGIRIFVAVLLFGMSACKQSSSVKNPTKPSYLYVQLAKNGRLSLVDESAGLYHLAMNGVDEETLYFSNRPMRQAGHMATQTFTADWAQGKNNFAQNPPNAALDVRHGKTREVYIVELLNPQYDSKAKLLNYDLKVIDAHPSMQKLDQISLFIDDQTLKGACNASDRRVAVNPNNLPFWGQVNQCAKAGMGNSDKTSQCLSVQYPKLSASCSQCFGDMANCVARNCMFKCMFDSMGEGCQKCANQNCNADVSGGFSLTTCTGVSDEKMPPH
jgi:hypothetical protein